MLSRGGIFYARLFCPWAGQLGGRGAVAHHVACKSNMPSDEGTASTVADALSTGSDRILVVLATTSMALSSPRWASYQG
jgi:hypothetical protein